jgi:hypothetical protein
MQIGRPLPDPPHAAGRSKRAKRLAKRLVKKPDGRYLIYYEKR